MNKLLAANFIRLKKSKLFYLILAFTILSTCLSLINNYETNRQLEAWHAGMEDSAFVPTTAMHLLYNMTPVLGLLAAFMIAMFIGTEYHDNTMRNKLICGQSRSRVYLANLLTCVFITMLFYLIPVLMTLVIGIPLLGMPHVTSASLLQLLVFGVIGLLISVVYASIFTLAAMLLHNRSYALISCTILAMTLLIFGTFCNSRLEEPEYYSSYELGLTEDGTQTVLPTEPVKNPLYLDDSARQVVTFLYDFLPGGQTIQIADLHVTRPYLLMLYSIGIVAISTAAGFCFFSKKDLR